MHLHFLAFEKQNFEKAKIAILPVPYERTVTYRKGTRMGPAAILRASETLEDYDEEFRRELTWDRVFTYPIPRRAPKRPERVIAAIKNNVLRIVEHNKFPLLLGGEHSITVGAVKALRQKERDFSVLWLDAHFDLRDTWNGSKFNHACCARRVLEEGLSIVWVGIRSVAKEEAEFIKQKKMKNNIFYAPRIPIDTILKKLRKKVYLTFDFDVLDPSCMPSVGTPQPGGINWYQTADLIKKVSERHKLIGADFVEFCPIPGFVAPDVLAAKLVYKLIHYLL